MEAVRVLYIDLDGTVRKCMEDGIGYVNKVEDVVVYDGVKEKLERYTARGWRIVAVTNQGGVAMGAMSMQTLESTLVETARQLGFPFTKMMACPHHPDAKKKKDAVCWCRKPRIGNVVSAADSMGSMFKGEYYPPHMALFVGDREDDRGCAENAGIQFMDAKEWRAASVEELLKTGLL